MTRVITLTTDFGITDEYAGVLKGVILCHCPAARIIDITHSIPPQNIMAAARMVGRYAPFFPPATIHLVIVDPGVGTDRAIVVADDGLHLFIGPDNGVLTPVLRSSRLRCCHVLDVKKVAAVSSTFHGRDIMAPLAGRLASGMSLSEVGPKVSAADCVHLHLPAAVKGKDLVRGEVVAIDHFGNITTSIPAEDLLQFAGQISVQVGESKISGLGETYADRREGALLCLIDSRGWLEIAVNRGNAAEKLSCSPGDLVEVKGNHRCCP